MPISTGKNLYSGVYGGVFYNIKTGEVISVQPELVYSGQGVKGEGGKIVLSYINLTPLVRYNNAGFFVGIGPQVGFLLSAKSKPDGGSGEDIKDQLKGTDIAAVIATGYELASGIGFYARYNHGLTTISDDSNDKIFNRVFQIGLRYRINTNKK